MQLVFLESLFNLPPKFPSDNWDQHNKNYDASDNDVNHCRNRELFWRWC